MKTAIIQVILWDRVDFSFVRIIDDKITQIGSMEEFCPDAEETIIDGKGGILMPGMVNTHTHLPMIPFRGLGDDCKDRLRVFLLPMENKWMSKELVAAAARYGIAELLLSGVTTVVDMYYFEDEIMKAADELGIRGFFGETLMEDATCDFATPKEALEETRRLLEKWKNHSRVHACVAPHGTTTCSKETLQAGAALANEYQVPFTVHTAEMDYEMSYFRNERNQTPIEYLEEIDVLSKNFLGAHCIHIEETDIEILKKYQTSVAHCIGSNTKAAKGVAPLTQLRNTDIPVGLGTDGPASGNTLDILTQFKLVANFHKVATKDRSAWPTKNIVELGTIGGANAIGLGEITGSIEVGKQADFVLLETESVNMFPVYEPSSTIVYSANASNVESVWVAGKQVVADKILVSGNFKKIKRDLIEEMKKTEFQCVMLHG